MLIPFAEKKLIKPGANDPRIKARLGILHVDANNSPDLYRWFNGPSGGIESHTHIRKDGHLYQYRDTDYEADANFRANPFAFSVETQGYAEGEWTNDQLTMIKRLMVWGGINLEIPLVKPKRWDGEGWGYHIQFGEWHPEPKACPGRERIEQYNDILVPWMGVANMAIEDTILNRADRTLASNVRIERMLELLLTDEQRKVAKERADAWLEDHPVHKG